jgi:hypothetical protein
LTLPAATPATTPAGRWSLSVAGLWSSTFVWNQNRSGEAPELRRFLVDGDSLTVDAAVRRGLTRDLDVGLRLPVRWRGAGALDGPIDFWHRLTGLPDNHRPDFLQNAFRVEGLTDDGGSFSWQGDTGWGLGNLELDARWRALGDATSRATSIAVVGRLSLPTGTSCFSGQGTGGGGQIVFGWPLARKWDAFAGIGGTVQSAAEQSGVRYAPARAHGFAALEWRPWRRVSLIAETNAASRLVTNVVAYPGLHWLLNVGARIDIGRRARLDLSLTEGITSQDATTDVAFHLALGLRP